MRLDEKILDYIKRTGPCTPIEVAQRVGSDSLIVAAVLVDAVSQKKIKRSKRKAGGSHRYYYYQEQLSMLQKRINSVLTPQDKEMVQKILDKKMFSELEVEPQEVSILSGLEDLITGFTFEYDNHLIRGWCAPNIPEEKAREDVLKKLQKKLQKEAAKEEAAKEEEAPAPKQEEPKAAEPEEPKKKPQPEEKKEKEQEKPTSQSKESPKKEKKDEESKEDIKEQIRKEVLAEVKGSFVDNIIQALEKQEIDLTDQRVVKKDKEYEMIISVPTKLGITQRYLVRIFDHGKKKIGSKDIFSLGMDAISRKIPAIAVSSTGFAKTAIKKWKEELQDMMLLMTEDDLSDI
ncbi:MAG: hypothetical protein QF475_01100 [Candidatus Undinarchaeales archaeon]|nr:hypothetical protein [Candidatus Undinarchaeales archaeon]